jgi:hypothetical protein
MLVRTFPQRTLLMLLITALALAACNAGATPAPAVDINAINTAAVATAMGQISSQLTQTALAAPPTNTPAPTNSPIPLATFALPTTGAGTAASPAASGALPTLSFNTTPNTTPIAGFTPLAGSTAAPVNAAPTCNNSAYIADVTIPDGTVLSPGEDFDKVWRIQNTGTCAWDEGYKLVFIGGERALDPTSFEINSADDYVDPGETVDMGVDLTAPEAEGSYTATWQMQSDSGAYFGTPLTVVIEVQD